MSEPEYNAYQRTDPYSAIPEVHLPWLLKVAGKFTDGPVRDSEQYSDACLGLMKAAKTYDPSKGVKFITYLVACVQMEIWSRHRNRQAKSGRKDGPKHFSIGFGDHEPMQPQSDHNVDSSVLEMLPAAIDHLTDLERTIIQKTLEGKKLREIGDDLGFSKQRAEQIRKRAIAKLRVAFESFGVEEI